MRKFLATAALVGTLTAIGLGAAATAAEAGGRAAGRANAPIGQGRA